jgi:hypothetical protein
VANNCHKYGINTVSILKQIISISSDQRTMTCRVKLSKVGEVLILFLNKRHVALAAVHRSCWRSKERYFDFRPTRVKSLTYESWLISRVFVGPRLLQIYNRAIEI